MKRAVLLIIICMAFAFGLLIFIGAGSEKESDEMINEQNEILSAVEGAWDVVGHLGVYQSEDGKTESLSEEELETIENEFNGKVDLYYTEDHPSYSYYKWLNSYLLTEGLKDNNDNTVDAGVLRVMPMDISINDSRDEAVVEAVLIVWTKRIIHEDTYYTLLNPIGRTHIKLRLVKENNQWKVCENLQCDDLDNASDTEAIKETNENSEIKTVTEEYMHAEDTDKVERAISENEKILEKQYSTYDEALQALNKVDVSYNRYMLE